MTKANEESTEPASPVPEEPVIKDGSDLYPERKGVDRRRTWFSKFSRRDDREDNQRISCELNVHKCIKNSAIVKLMINALKSSGCDFDMRRHISCEVCDKSVTGGYDPQLNQIVVCQNNAKHHTFVQGVLTHEMIHMFDMCRNYVDLKLLDHIACTEIRAANLCHCSFMSSWIQGAATLFSFKKRHQDCVKQKALKSVLAVQNVSEDEARAAVLRVFDKCYNDLEPIGRRIRRGSDDMDKAYIEGPLYGYCNQSTK